MEGQLCGSIRDGMIGRNSVGDGEAVVLEAWNLEIGIHTHTPTLGRGNIGWLVQLIHQFIYKPFISNMVFIYLSIKLNVYKIKTQEIR